jgi:hypothetical protein
VGFTPATLTRSNPVSPPDYPANRPKLLIISSFS